MSDRTYIPAPSQAKSWARALVGMSLLSLAFLGLFDWHENAWRLVKFGWIALAGSLFVFAGIGRLMR